MKKPTCFLEVNDILFDLSSKCGSNSCLRIILHDRGLKSGSDLRQNTFWNFCKKNQIFYDVLSKTKVKFVRNPYNRVVSLFLHYNRASRTNFSFIEWLNVIKNIYEEDYKLGPELLQNIRKILPSISERTLDFMYKQTNDEDIKYDHIIKIENLKTDIAKLNKMYKVNFPEVEPMENSCNKVRSVNKKIDYTTAKFRTFSGKYTNDYNSYYNKESIDLVTKIYEEDIINFNYESKGIL
jgi:hypothetical protein